MTAFRLVLTLLGVAHLSTATVFNPLPTSYVTAESIYGRGKQVTRFVAHVCGGEAFDNQTAILSLNMPTQTWNYERGDFLKATVFGSDSTLIATNKGATPSDWLQDVSFQYKKSYGDLYFTIQNGPGIGQVYTIALTFNNVNPTTSKIRRHFVTAEEVAVSKHFHMEMNTAGVQDEILVLVQVFRIETAGTVLANELVHFQLDYCFAPTMTPYQIDVSVVAADETSGFGTYVCPKHIQIDPGCDLDTPYADRSGSAVNIVSVPITQDDYGAVEVIVKGGGRYGQMNTFFLSGSRYYSETA